MIVIYSNASERLDVILHLLFFRKPRCRQPFKIRIRFWRQLFEQRQCPRIARTPVREELCEVFQAAALCVFAHRRICCFQLVQAIMFLRETEQGILIEAEVFGDGVDMWLKGQNVEMM